MGFSWPNFDPVTALDIWCTIQFRKTGKGLPVKELPALLALLYAEC
jgi:hypothetical protein